MLERYVRKILGRLYYHTYYYIKNVLFYYVVNYRKILEIYEDELSKKYVREYIKNRLIYHHYRKINYLRCSNDEVEEIKRLIEYIGDNEFVIEGLKFRYPKAHPYIVRDIYDIIFPTVFLYHYGLKNLDVNVLSKIKNGHIIDCGAFIGDSSIILSYYTDHKVFAFEPDKSVFNYLVENIKINNLNNKVIPINYGVGDKEEILNFGEMKFKITTIDNFIKKKKINKVSLIKMDIEGYELKALKGARKTIKKYKPVLIISAYHKIEDILEIPYYLKKLVSEYKFKFLDLKKSHSTFEKVIIAYKI